MDKFNFVIMVALNLILTATQVNSQSYLSQIFEQRPLINNKANGVVLYEQMTNYGTTSVTSQDFETIYDAYDCQLADDFIIPSADSIWTIESIEVFGIYYNGTGPANSVDVWIYNDNLGSPGTIVTSIVDIVPADGLSTGSFVITFGSPVILSANTYWLSVQCNMDSAIGGLWGWKEHLQSNLESVWQNPNGGWATTCTVWGYRVTNCNIGTAAYPDLSFRLKGYKGDPCPVTEGSNPSPSNGENNIPITGVTLEWVNGEETENVELWLGPNDRLLKLYDGPSINSWPLGNLNYSTSYGWFIVCKNDTCDISSPKWSFTTSQDTNLLVATIDVYPQNSNNWTGTCSPASKTQISLVNGIDTEIGWMVFDISSIPNNVTINSVTFNGYLYENSWPYWSITPMGNINPVTDAAYLIFNQVSNHYAQGTAYSYNLETRTLANDWLIRPLGSSVTADLQSALVKNWFAIGVLDFDFSSNYFVKFHGWSEANQPFLRVIYSLRLSTFQFAFDVADGWNLISIPGNLPVSQNIDSWWPYRDPGTYVYKYFGLYQSVTEATPGTGYWMKHSGARTYDTGDEWPTEGIQIVAHNPINGLAGWNLISGYEESIPAANIITTPPGLQSGPIYKFSGGYQIAATIEPGYGYWMKLMEAGQIILTGSIEKTGKEEQWFNEDWGKITITDNANRKFTLYAISGDVDLDQYTLPPLPPAGSFDIRFSSGRIAEDISSSVQTIDMRGVTYPLTVRSEGMDMRLMDETGKTVNVNLRSGEEVVISDATIQKLMVSGETIPTVYALEQNYPNPFNPSTVIEFSLPEDVGNVKLSIYNALGEKVAELVNTSLTAGRYSYQWNAQNVATGMYVYELRTDKFVSVKKMLLLK